jgi:hypothetical protein
MGKNPQKFRALKSRGRGGMGGASSTGKSARVLSSFKNHFSKNSAQPNLNLAPHCKSEQT